MKAKTALTILLLAAVFIFTMAATLPTGTPSHAYPLVSSFGTGDTVVINVRSNSSWFTRNILLNTIVAEAVAQSGGESAWRAADTAISNHLATISNQFRAADTEISNNFWASNVAIISQVLQVSNQMRTADTAISNNMVRFTNGLATGLNSTNTRLWRLTTFDFNQNGSPYTLWTNSMSGSSFYLWDSGLIGNIFMGDLENAGVRLGSLGVLPFGGNENMGQTNAPWKQVTARRVQFIPVETDSGAAIYLDLTNRVHTITLTNNVTFHTTNRISGVVQESYAILTASGANRTIAVNSGWGKTTDMSSITLTNGTRAILSLICTGDSETNVIAAYANIQ
jgi:hypothetical protein